MDVMIDFETKGLAPGFGLRSMGAVRFDRLTGVVESVFYRNIDDPRPGCPRTKEWWDGQSREAQEVLEEGKMGLSLSIAHFAEWFNDGDMLWAHGAAFDIPHLEEAYRHVGSVCPVSYRDYRDTRTVYDLAGGTPRPHWVMTEVGPRRTDDLVAHNALDDCYFQVAQLCEAVRKVRSVLNTAQEALKFYSHPGDYTAPQTLFTPHGDNKLYFDCGSRAREALNRIGTVGHWLSAEAAVTHG